MKRLGLVFLILLAVGLAVGLSFRLSRPPNAGSTAPAARPDKRAVFEQWLGAAPGRREEFARFEAFIAHEGVADVVPAWQLTRADSLIAERCVGGPHEIPPQELWPNAVPVLRFVRARIVPAIGPVEAVSAWRSPRANRCSNGAKGSKHLTFHGIDFIAPGLTDARVLFTRLCAVHARYGPGDGFGLGAYFDPDDRRQNAIGRFHVDVAGFRTWGFGYGGAASGCSKL